MYDICQIAKADMSWLQQPLCSASSSCCCSAIHSGPLVVPETPDPHTVPRRTSPLPAAAANRATMQALKPLASVLGASLV